MDENIVDDRCTISSVHSDIVHTHILTRLDGPSLASVGTTSCELRSLSSSDSLWRDICHKVWPATAHPRLRHVIASFPSGHRSFYANCHSTLHRRHLSPALRRQPHWFSYFISAVDLHYKNEKLLLSKVIDTDVSLCSWSWSQFQVELLSPGQSLPIPGKLDIRHNNITCESELEASLSLSWVLIDPAQTCSASLTSRKPVSVDRDWSTGDVEVRFGTVLCGEGKEELVECVVIVTCGSWGNGDLHLKQVRLEIEDVEGNKLGWRECLVILQQAMENGDRTRGGEKGAYDEFMEIKKERRERKLRRERRQEEVGVWTGAVMVVGFWVFATVRFFQFLCSYFLFSFKSRCTDSQTLSKMTSKQQLLCIYTV